MRLGSGGGVLLVCWGNRCRSPMAEAALRLAMREAGVIFPVASAGVGPRYIGQGADYRASIIAARNGASLAGHVVKPLVDQDFRRFAYVLAMDSNNLADVEARRPGDGTAQAMLLMDCVGGARGKVIADPYRGGLDDFQRVWDDVARAAPYIIDLITVHN